MTTGLASLPVVGWPARRPNSALAGALFGSMLALVLALFTSWFAPDFGAVYLFSAGAAAGQSILPAGSSQRPSARSPSIEKRPTRATVHFQLAPGYPPARSIEK